MSEIVIVINEFGQCCITLPNYHFVVYFIVKGIKLLWCKLKYIIFWCISKLICNMAAICTRLCLIKYFTFWYDIIYVDFYVETVLHFIAPFILIRVCWWDGNPQQKIHKTVLSLVTKLDIVYQRTGCIWPPLLTEAGLGIVLQVNQIHKYHSSTWQPPATDEGRIRHSLIGKSDSDVSKTCDKIKVKTKTLWARPRL